MGRMMIIIGTKSVVAIAVVIGLLIMPYSISYQKASAAPESAQYFFIKSKLNGLVIDIPNKDPRPGVALQTYPAKASDNANQLWLLTKDGFIKSKLNESNVIDIRNGDPRVHAVLQTFPAKATNNANQRWTITADGFIQSILNGLVIDIANANPNPHAVLQTYLQKQSDTENPENQQWEIVFSPPIIHTYTVRMESIPIISKMAVFRDTVYTSISAKVDDKPPLEASKFMGDLDSGHTHPCVSGQIIRMKICNPPILQLGPLQVASGQDLEFSYTVLNKGGSGTVLQGLNAAANLAKNALNAKIPFSGLTVDIILALFPGIFTGGACNGVPAVDYIKVPSYILNQWTGTSASHTESHDYFRPPPARGCGGSHYIVTWTVTRVS